MEPPSLFACGTSPLHDGRQHWPADWHCKWQLCKEDIEIQDDDDYHYHCSNNDDDDVEYYGDGEIYSRVDY